MQGLGLHSRQTTRPPLRPENPLKIAQKTQQPSKRILLELSSHKGGLGKPSTMPAESAHFNSAESARERGNDEVRKGLKGDTKALVKAEKLYVLAESLYNEVQAEEAPAAVCGLIKTFQNRALVRQKLGKYSEALHDCDEALSLDPKADKVSLPLS